VNGISSILPSEYLVYY